MQNLNQLLKILLEAKIDFVLIGGYAGVVHGCSQLTQDLDICISMNQKSIDQLRACLKDLNPKLRMNPNHKPSFLENPKSTDGLNAIYLETDIGVLDILKSVNGVGPFEALNSKAVIVDLFGNPCKVISLDHLIQAKESMGREKDKSILNELYAIRDKLRK